MVYPEWPSKWSLPVQVRPSGGWLQYLINVYSMQELGVKCLVIFECKQTYQQAYQKYKDRIFLFLDIGRQEDFRWNFAICSGHFFAFHYCGNSMGSAASHHILHQNNCKFPFLPSFSSYLKTFSIASSITFTSGKIWYSSAESFWYAFKSYTAVEH